MRPEPSSEASIFDKRLIPFPIISVDSASAILKGLDEATRSYWHLVRSYVSANQAQARQALTQTPDSNTGFLAKWLVGSLSSQINYTPASEPTREKQGLD